MSTPYCPEFGFRFGSAENYSWSDTVLTMLCFADGIKEHTQPVLDNICTHVKKATTETLIDVLDAQALTLIENLKTTSYYNSFENRYIQNEDCLDLLQLYLGFLILAYYKESKGLKETLYENAHVRPELLMLSRKNPIVDIDDLQDIPFILEHDTAENLFTLLAALFPTLNAQIENNGLIAWFPFTKTGTFDNRLYSLFTNEESMKALMVHGILKDNRFEKSCFLRAQELKPVGEIKVRGNSLSAICTFSSVLHSVFVCNEELNFYEPSVGLIDFNSTALLTGISKTTDSASLRAVINYVDNNTYDPVFFNVKGLLYKNNEELTYLSNARKLETQLHESVNPKYNINNIRAKTPIFLTFLVEKDGRRALRFGFASIETLQLMETDYKPNDPMQALWSEANGFLRQTARQSLEFKLHDKKALYGENIFIYNNGNNSFAYNGEHAYEIDESGEKSTNVIIYDHEFVIGKTYRIELLDEKFKLLENKVISTKPDVRYNRIRVDLTNINLFNETTDAFDSSDVGTIIRIYQYQSQDIVNIG